MTAPTPKKERKLTDAAIAALWVLRHDHHTGQSAFRSAASIAEGIGYMSSSSIRYGITVLEQERLALFHGYEFRGFTRTRVMTWSFNPEAEARAKAIIEASHELLVEHSSEYRRVSGYYESMTVADITAKYQQ